MATEESTRTICKRDTGFILYQKGYGNSDNNKPQVIKSDIDACNGIIHVVNKVILPQFKKNALHYILDEKEEEEEEEKKRTKKNNTQTQTVALTILSGEFCTKTEREREIKETSG